MSGTLVRISTDGQLKRVDVEGSPSLEILQTLVGGWIEPTMVQWEGKKCRAYIDEEGKLKDLPFNDLASTAFVAYNGPGDIIVGPMVVWIPKVKKIKKFRSTFSQEAGA